MPGATATLSETRVSVAMTRGTLTCQAETPLRTVARMMSEHGVHSVVVTDMDGVGEWAWGVVTDVDLMGAAHADLDERTAGDSGATELVVVSPSETLDRAAQLMSDHEVTHLVVVEDEKPIGVLSSLDVAAVLAG
jgi:CBS domain-containing protein